MLIFICLSLNTVSANNITISNSTPGGINGALSSANSSDTIILQPGSYSGSNNNNLQVGKSITIRGNGSPNQVIINGSGVNQLFSTAGSSLNITFINITFTNAATVMTDYQSATITFVNCTFTDNKNSALSMGYNSNYNVINCSFINNTAQAGGAINNNGGNLNVINSIFVNNTANSIGGAINNNNGHSNTTNSTFIGNNASSDGGAISISGSVDIIITLSYFYNNTAISGVGGAVFSNAGHTIVNRSDFVNNTDIGDGGAVGMDGGNVTLNYNRFYNNNATPTGYQVYAGGGTFDFSMNWWGDNDRAYYYDNAGHHNVSTNWVVVNVNYTGNGSSDPNSEFYYYIQLSDGSAFDPTLLPWFTLDEGAGPNPTLIPQWDARTNQTVYVAVVPYSTMVTFGVDDWRKVFWANGTEIINLTVTKVANVTDVDTGQFVNYTITVTNHGPSNATNVILNEILPSTLIYQSSIPSVGTYNPVTGVWNIGDLADGATVTLVIIVQVNGTGIIVNGVNVTADQSNVNNDTNGSNITANITVRPYVNLTVTKVANVNGAVVNGQTITYTITVTNHGPDDATNVKVNEILPSELILVGNSTTQGDYDGSVWYIGNISDGNSVTLVITVRVNAVTNGNNVTISNGVNITANQPNINEDTNNTNITVNVTVVPGVNLTVSKVANVTGGVVNGQTINYTIVVTNYGPDDATGVVVNEKLPASLIYVSDSVSGAYNPTTGVWTVGNLNNGQSAILVITVRVNASTGGNNVTISNGVNVTADQNNTNNDTNDTNVTENVTVVPGVNLTVSKVANVTGDVFEGQLINYTIVVTNYGPDDATNVVVNEVLPPTLIYQSSVPSVGTYNPSTGVWDIGTLTNGANATLVITVLVNSTGVIINGVNVTADQNNTNNDTNDTNITENITVRPCVNLTVTKTADVSDAVVNGQTISYTITVTNHGPDDATNVKVNEILPASLIYIISNPSQGTYDSSSGVWDIGSLLNGSSVTLVITVKVNVTTNGNNVTISNGVNVTANQTNINNDTNGSNITENITVVPSVNLTVTKVANVTGAVVNGQTIQYVITVINHGPDNATGVVVNEKLPNGLVYLSSVASKGAYNKNTGVWTVGNLNNGQSAILVITVRVNATTGGNNVTLSNGVNVTADQPNVNNETNDTNVTENITVVPGVNLTVSKVANVTGKVVIGQIVSYTIIVANYGPDNATGVVVNEKLPNGLVYLSSVASKGAYNKNTGVWNVGTLAVGQSATLVINVRANSTGVIVNSVNVTADQSNINGNTNNSNITANITVVQNNNSTNNTNKTNGNSVPGVAMKKTGVPLFAIVVLMSFFFGIGLKIRKRN